MIGEFGKTGRGTSLEAKAPPNPRSNQAFQPWPDVNGQGAAGNGGLTIGFPGSGTNLPKGSFEVIPAQSCFTLFFGER